MRDRLGDRAIAAADLPAAAPQPPASQQPPPQQPTELNFTISGEAGSAPRFAVPDFIALSPDAETAAIAKTIGQVLWDDLNFEREFALIPRDTYATIPAAKSMTDVPFDRWRELNADGVIIGTVQKNGMTITSKRVCSASRRGSRRSAKPTTARRRTRAATRTRSPTRSTSSSARCAASRGRS